MGVVSPLQTAIMRKSIDNPLFAKEILPKTPLSIFDGNEPYKEISGIIKRYYQSHRESLTEETLLTLAEDKLDRMKKSPEDKAEYFTAIKGIYDIRNLKDDDVIDEQIEKAIKKAMYKDLMMKAAMNMDNDKFMDKVADDWRLIMMMDVSGKVQEIINVIDDVEYKKRALSTLYTNVLSTGFADIDALNGGGLAKGELGMIVAASGTGKCTKGDTLVFTEKGIVEIKDVPQHFYVNSVTNESEACVASYTEKGEFTPRNTSHWYNLGLSKTIKVTTKAGYSVEGTPEHPLLVMNDRGSLEYKELRDFKQGDYVALAKPNMWSTEDKVSEEEAYMLALLVADGYLAQDSGLVSFSNSEGILIDYYKEQAKLLWNVTSIKSRRKQGSKTIDHDFNSSKVKKMLEGKGLKMVKSAEKEVPFTVLQSSREVVKRFIQGMFDTEGSIYKSTLELTTASKRMAEQLQIVLLNFGIRASLKPKKVKGYEHNNYYRLSITGLALKKFYSEIGFRFNDKYQKRLEEACVKNTNTNVEIFPYQGARLLRIKDNHLKGNPFWDGHTQKLDGKRLNGFFYNRSNPSKETIDYILSYTSCGDDDTKFLRNITNNLIFEPIESIIESETVVYDFTVPETHSFVANGIVSHNTMVLTNLATNYVKKGKNVLFVALEELENRMILKFEQSMLRQSKSTILSGSVLNEEVYNKMQETVQKYRSSLGNLFFARYSPRTVTPAKIEQLISDVKLRMGVELDVVVIDYPELLRNPNATGNESDDGGKLFEEMRRIGQDYNVIMWTAAQMNRTAYNATIRTSEHMEGSLRKKNAAELVLTVNQSPEEYNAGFIRLYADKVRNPPEGPYERMVGLRVIGSTNTIRDYKDNEREMHQQILSELENNSNQMFKSRKKENKAEAPDYANEINASIQRTRGGE